MAAHTDTATTEAFANLLYLMSDESDTDLTVDDAAESGWMVPAGQDLVVTDHESGTTYLLTVRKVTSW